MKLSKIKTIIFILHYVSKENLNSDFAKINDEFNRII